jgi:hypothetical protein
MIKSHELLDRLSKFIPYESVRFYCPINRQYYRIYGTSVNTPYRVIYLTTGHSVVYPCTYETLIFKLHKFTTCFDDIHFIDRDQGIDLKVL